MTACIGLNNITLSATVTAGSAALPAANVKGPHGTPSTGWQTAAGVITSGAGATLTVTPLTGAQVWRVMGVFGSNLTSSATVLFELWNTTGPTLVWSSSLGGPVSGYRQVVAVAPADKVADYLKISIDDASNTDGHINVPLVFAGPVWMPARNISYNSAPGHDEETVETVSRGGQEYPLALWQRRHWNVEFDSLANSEVWQHIDPLIMASRSGLNVFFCPDGASSYLQQEAIFGRLKTFTDVTYPYQAADRRRCQVTITERL